MQLSRPIGIALSELLLDRLDAIARTEGVSRSSVVRIFLVEALAEYERRTDHSDRFKADNASLSRSWRPRARQVCADPTCTSIQHGE